MTAQLAPSATSAHPAIAVTYALSRRRAFAPTMIGLIGFLISFIGSWVPSVWYDEAATITSATRSWAELWQEIQHVDAVHATYYAAMHVVFQVFGYSPLILRLPSSVAIGLTAAVIVVLVRRVGTPSLAVTAGILFVLLPRVTWAGGEGRSYAASALLAALLTLVLARALESSGRRWWIVYGALVVLSGLVFVYLALVVLAHGIGILVSLRRRQWPPLRTALRFFGAVVAAGVILIPFALLIRGEREQISWIAPIGSATVQQVYLTQWFWGTEVFPAVAWILLVIGAVVLLRRRGGTLPMLVLPALVVPTAALILISALAQPLYSPRYLAMCTPFVAIVMAVAIDRMRRRWVTIALIAVLAAFALPHVVTVQRAVDAKKATSWSQVADLISHERATHDAGLREAIIYGPVRYHPTATTRVIEYAYPTAFAGTIDVTLKTPAAKSGTLWETHSSLANSVSRLRDADVAYLITSVKRDRRPQTTAILGDLGWHLDQNWSFTDVNVLRYVRN